MAFAIRKYAKPGDALNPNRIIASEAPGASWSPQMPGEAPDRSDIPGESQLPVPPPEEQGVRELPGTEFGTSQLIMHVFAPEGGNADDPTRYEQAPVSYEEVRKANPALRTPLRPTPGYALADGIRQPGPELAALDATSGTSEPAPGE